MLKLAAALLLLVGVEASRCPSNYPTCNNLNGTFVNIDVASYMGRWYVQQSSEAFIFGKVHPLIMLGIDCYCEAATYGLVNSNTISVNNACHLKSPTGTLNVVRPRALTAQINGTAHPTNTQDLCELEVYFGEPIGGPYAIVVYDTEDYQWAVVASCLISDLSDIWILSRVPAMQPSLLKELLAWLTAKGFGISDLVTQYQGSDCTYEAY